MPGIRSVGRALLAGSLAAAGLSVVGPRLVPIASNAGDGLTRGRLAGAVTPASDFDFASVFVPLDFVGQRSFSRYTYGDLEVGGPGLAADLVDGLRPPSADTAHPCRVRRAAIQEVATRSVRAHFDVARPGGTTTTTVTPGPVPRATTTTLAVAPPGAVPTTTTTQPRFRGNAHVADVVVSVLDPETSADPGFQASWTACMVSAAEEGTQALTTTVRGHPAVSFTQVAGTAPTRTFTDVVAWLEPGLEVLVVGRTPSDGLLAVTTNPTEPVLEIAQVIVSRAFDPVDVLLDEAFAERLGLRYGEPTPGAKSLALAAFRDTLQRQPVSPAPDRDPTLLVEDVVERPVVAGGLAGTRVQVVVWDPEFLNTRAFRQGWLEGIRRAADAPDDVVVDRTRRGVRLFATSTAEGTTQAHFVTDCYTVKVAGPGAAALAARVIEAQRQARAERFGPTGGLSGTERDTRNVQLCSAANLSFFLRGTPVVDGDRDGVADEFEEKAAR